MHYDWHSLRLGPPFSECTPHAPLHLLKGWDSVYLGCLRMRFMERHYISVVGWCEQWFIRHQLL